MKTEKIISNWAKALSAVLEQKTEKEKERVFKRLSEALKKRKRAYLLLPILKKTEKIFRQKSGARLILAKSQDSAFLREIKEGLLKFLGKDKRQIETVFQEDLIAGFRLQTGSYLIKASARDYLDSLKENLYGKN